jgi:DHA2 family multidrug resistance protein
LFSYYQGKTGTEKLAEHFALQDGFLATAVLILLALIPARKLPQRTRKRLKEKEVLG